MKDALLYNLLRYKMSTEDRKEIFDSYLDYDQVVKFSQSVDGAIFENYMGGNPGRSLYCRIRLLGQTLPNLLYLRELAGYDGLCGI